MRRLQDSAFSRPSPEVNRDRTSGALLALTLASILAGCASAPPERPSPQMSPPEQLSVERYQVTLEPGVVLDYQVEQKRSRVNARACFAYITGVLYNRTGEPLSRKSRLDVQVFSQGRQVFRDQTYPLADLAPGTGAGIEMVTSPVHNDGCPKYERLQIGFFKVLP